MKYNFFIFIVLLCVDISLEAQYSNLNFFSLHQHQGLSDNSVTSIIKDKDGYLWFGTQNGLNMYDGYTFKKFYAGHDSTSLPENKIRSLFLSSKGDLWIAFENEGISKYISKSESFKHFNFVKENRSLASNIVKGLTEDTDSVLYVATSEGVFYKKQQEPEFNTLALPDTLLNTKIPSENSLVSPMISAITSDERTGIWIAYENWWISHYNPKNQKFSHYNLQDYASDSYQTLITSLISHKEKLWLGTIGAGLIKYDPDSGKTEILNDIVPFPVHHIELSTDETFWISSSNGLISFNPENSEYQRFTNIPEDNRSLASTPLQHSYEDKSGILLVGTSNAGISYAFPNKQFRHMLVGLPNFYTLSHMDVTSILQDKSGNIWIGYRGGYIEMHDIMKGERHSIEISSLFSPNPPGTIFDIAEALNGEIYCASWQGGLQKFNPDNFRFEPVTGSAESFLQKFEGADIRDVEIDKNGDIWLTLHGKGLYRYNTQNGDIKIFTQETELENNTGLSNNWVYDICLDGDEFVWVTSAHGLSRISKADHKIKRYYKTEQQSSLAQNTTTFAYRDLKGNIWIGTPNHLNLYIRGTDRFQRFNPGMSTKPMQIKSLIQDSTGIYWAGTSGGIIKFELLQTPYDTPQLSTIGHFDIDDGLQSESFNLQSVSVNSDGLIFFGGDKGIDYFHPEEINPSDPEPLIRIKNIEIFGEEVYPGTPGGPEISADDKILLNYNQNMIGIEYVALNYFNNDNNLYSYILEPLNSDWIEAEKNREILFSNLEPGHYSLSLKVTTDQEEVYISDRILNFHIQPPFWETLWFRISLVLLIFAIIILSIMFYTKNLRQKHILLESLVEKRTNQLSQKNTVLREQRNELRSANLLLRKRQTQIQKQTTELKIQSDQLSKNNEELNMLNSMKDKFLSIIAHDLKNPFNTLLGFSELLKEEFDTLSDNRKKEMISYIHESSMGSRNLLDNLLDWSRSQTKRIKVRSESLNMNKLFDNIHELFMPMLEKKDIILEKEISNELEVWADRDLLNTILRNLISNAIKFTPSGGKIWIKTCAASTDKVCVEIKDSGVGMDADEVKNIFKMDSAKQSQGTAGEKGTGLGMMLVKEFTELMNGNLRIESEKNRGTSVFVYLPAN